MKLNKDNLLPGTKVKIKDEPECHCPMCRDLAGRTLIVSHAEFNIVHFEEEGTGYEEPNMNISDVEKILPSIPEELFQV